MPAGAKLLVVDAQSSDATVALAHEAGAEVVVRAWEGFVATRNFARERVATPWTFMLDADESLDDLARAALVALEPQADTDGYRIARITNFCGRPIRHGAWGSEAPLRLFRTERALSLAEPVAGGSAQVHERWIVAGEERMVAGTIVHDSYPTLRVYREKFSRYTTLEARGTRGSGMALGAALLRCGVRVPWLLIGKSGWRDGWRGVFIALASAAYPVVVAWKALRR